MELSVAEIVSHFDIALDDEELIPYGNGHINETFVVGQKQRYILQKINTTVFTNPDAMMENIIAVTDHLRKKIAAEGGDPDRETLTPIYTKDGKSCYHAPDGYCYRTYLFVEALCFDAVEDPHQLYHAACAFGKFQRLLADFPAEGLFEVIPRFHDTANRFAHLRNAIENNAAGRVGEVEKEISFALSREADTHVVLDAIAAGEVPVRVTHNDTKLNNVMFDSETREGLCVIDLDTVMPGSLLYDFGDALRFGANAGAEDETDLSKIYFRMDCFEEFTRGFLRELGDTLTPREIELLPFSVKLMTYECGIRFLTDYLNGDTYFRIHREKHNLDRCRTQFALVADIEKKMDEMHAIVQKCLQERGNK
ncbi:MAG: aminoglycoside phosphotransferase family protein [Clostridia bacterium]|nr:aminoglycoside phosphotransferase family protein [Clostridia bacterium]